MNFSFISFDAMLEAAEDKNPEIVKEIESVEDRLKSLVDYIETETDNMMEDYKYDHDNYDSLTRERNLKQRKEEAEKVSKRLYYLLFNVSAKDADSIIWSSC